MRHVLDAAAASDMPTDPRLWLDAPPVSSYPACQAVKAAADQGLDEPYLRVVREGLMVDRVKLDNADALIGAARRVPGLDVERFAIDLHSAAIVEAFGADMERARAAAREGERRVPFPSFAVRGEDGEAVHWVYDSVDPEQLRAAALAAGAASRPAADRPRGGDPLRAHRHAGGGRRLRSPRAAGRGRAVAAGRGLEAQRRARPDRGAVESGSGLPMPRWWPCAGELPHRGEGVPAAEAGAVVPVANRSGLGSVSGLNPEQFGLQRRARPAERRGGLLPLGEAVERTRSAARADADEAGLSTGRRARARSARWRSARGGRTARDRARRCGPRACRRRSSA